MRNRDKPKTACRRCQCTPGWSEIVTSLTRPVSIPDKKGSLAKGSWHAGGVTEGFHSRHFPKSSKLMWRGTLPIAPSGRELSPQVTEGASGRCSHGFTKGWYLLISIDNLC